MQLSNLSTPKRKHESFNSSPTASPQNFQAICRSHLKINKKNAFLKEKLLMTPVNSRSYASFTFNEERGVLEERVIEEDIFEFTDVSNRYDFGDSLAFFILRRSELRNLVSDYENENEKSDNSELSANHKALFRFAQLAAYRSEFIKALEYIEKAILVFADILYLKWSVVLFIKLQQEQHKKEDGLWERLKACYGGALDAHEVYRKRLKALPLSLETIWIEMEMWILQDDEDAAKYYATCIKNIDKYYGYLAWSQIYAKKSLDKAVDLLKGLIKEYPGRPEAYVKLWGYYYEIKDYESSEDTAAEAFLRVTDCEYSKYYLNFCMMYSKSYEKTGKILSALQLLQKKFLENSEFSVLLYQFSKVSCKSEEEMHLTASINGFLECKRICEQSRLGVIYYWLSKAYIRKKSYIKAYKYVKKALGLLGSYHQRKIKELELWANDMKKYIELVSLAEKKLMKQKNKKIIEEALILCLKMNKFYKEFSELLYIQILARVDKENSIFRLKRICETNEKCDISWFLLGKYLKETGNYAELEKAALRMQVLSNDPFVSIDIWVKSNILYAKALVKNGKSARAITVLKLIAKLFTPLSYLSLPYTRALQNSSSLRELKFPNFLQFKLSGSLDVSLDSNQDFSIKPLDENDAPVPSLKNIKKIREEFQSSQAFKPFKKHWIKMAEDLDDELLDDEENDMIGLSGRENTEISVYSKPKFLYLIAKIAVKSKNFIEDGLCAATDFIEISKARKQHEWYRSHISKAESLYATLLALRSI